MWEPCSSLKVEEEVGGDSKKKGIQGPVSYLKKFTKLKPGGRMRKTRGLVLGEAYGIESRNPLFQNQDPGYLCKVLT